MRSRINALARAAAVPSIVAVVVLGAGTAFATGGATSLTGSHGHVAADPGTTVAATSADTAADTATDPVLDPSDVATDPVVDPSDTITVDPTETAPPTDPPITCDTAPTHGAWVAYVAHATPRGPGFKDAVRAAAHSDCGKHGDGHGDKPHHDKGGHGPHHGHGHGHGDKPHHGKGGHDGSGPGGTPTGTPTDPASGTPSDSPSSTPPGLRAR